LELNLPRKAATGSSLKDAYLEVWPLTFGRWRLVETDGLGVDGFW